MKRDIEAINDVCPKCGKPYLSIKDWGRVGALFIHGYDTDEASSMRHKVACHVPEPVALGKMSIEAWREAR